MNSNALVPVLAATAALAAGNPSGFPSDMPVTTISPTAMDYCGSYFSSDVKPPRPDQINWPRNQRKNRKNARRACAAGARFPFSK